MSDDLNALRRIARKNADETDAELQKELEALRGVTRSRLQELRPKLATDNATFAKLVEVVEQATADNIAIAEFTDRLKGLGKNVLAVAKKAAALLP